METHLATTQKSLAFQSISAEQADLIKRTVCRGASDDELALFLHICERTGLDPFARQIHAIKRYDSAASREVMSFQTGIDGFRLIADRTGLYAGNDEPTYEVASDGRRPTLARAVVYKLVAGQRVPFTAVARWDEYVAKKRDGSPNTFWANKPYLMLGKCAEAAALRKAFPAELAGVYVHEEMEGTENEPAKLKLDVTTGEIGIEGDTIDVPAEPVEPKPKSPRDEARDVLLALMGLAGRPANTWTEKERTELADTIEYLCNNAKVEPRRMLRDIPDADLPAFIAACNKEASRG